MTEPDKPDTRGTAPMLERIRNRRTALGLSGTELARRADISPSYVSLIERGLKVPDEDAATRLARALDDDEELYRAWAGAQRYGLDRLDELQRLQTLTTDAQTVRILASGRDLPPAAPARPAPRGGFSAAAGRILGVLPRRARGSSPAPPPPASALAEGDVALSEGPPDDVAAMDMAEAEASVPSDRVVEVPVLPAGADPRRMLDADALPPLHLDARLLGEGTAGLFAYELDREAAARLGPIASAGDYVVFTRRVRRLAAERVYAVRGEDERIHLGRVLFKGNALLLLPAAGSDIEVVRLRDEEPWRERVVGAMVLTLKRWS